MTNQNVVPANFGFFKLSRFSALSETNEEVAGILEETCVMLETQANSPAMNVVGCTSNRRSIVDPAVVKMRGSRTFSTSSKVDRRAAPPRTKMADEFQTRALKRKVESLRKKHHTCPVCLTRGHHAKTCRDLLSQENSTRCDECLKRLKRAGKLKEFLDSLSKRRSPKLQRECSPSGEVEFG